MCRRLAELGMAMAEAAAQRALGREPDPDAEAPDPSLAFGRITHSVRQSIALEVRIVAGIDAAATQRTASRTLADPRREPVRRVLHHAVGGIPKPAAFRREIDEHLDVQLANDPDQHLTVADLIDHLCETLHIEIDFNKLPNELLNDIVPNCLLEEADPPPW